MSHWMKLVIFSDLGILKQTLPPYSSPLQRLGGEGILVVVCA